MNDQADRELPSTSSTQEAPGVSEAGSEAKPARKAPRSRSPRKTSEPEKASDLLTATETDANSLAAENALEMDAPAKAKRAPRRKKADADGAATAPRGEAANAQPAAASFARESEPVDSSLSDEPSENIAQNEDSEEEAKTASSETNDPAASIGGQKKSSKKPEPTTIYGLVKDLGSVNADSAAARVAMQAAKDRGMDLGGKNAKGLNGLHACAQIGRWDIARELMDLGADPLSKSKTGLSFFAMAARDKKAPFEWLFENYPQLIERKVARDAARLAGGSAAKAPREQNPQLAARETDSADSGEFANGAKNEGGEGASQGESKPLSRSAKKRKAAKERKARQLNAEPGVEGGLGEGVEAAQGQSVKGHFKSAIARPEPKAKALDKPAKKAKDRQTQAEKPARKERQKQDPQERATFALSAEELAEQASWTQEERELRQLELADQLAWARANGLDAPAEARGQLQAMAREAKKPVAVAKAEGGEWGVGLPSLSHEESQEGLVQSIYWPQDEAMSVSQAFEKAVAAAASGSLAELEIYLSLGVDARLSRNGLTFTQALSNIEDTAPLLASLESGLDVNARNGDGETALMSALDRGDFDRARLLATHGADINARDQKGQTALIRQVEADTEHCDDAVEWLLGFGADAKLRDGQGRQAGQIAEAKGLFDIADMLEAHLESSPAPASIGAPSQDFEALLRAPGQKKNGVAAKNSTKKKTFGSPVEANGNKPAAKTAAKSTGKRKSGAQTKPRAAGSRSADGAIKKFTASKGKKGKGRKDPLAQATNPNRTGFVSHSLGRAQRDNPREWWEKSESAPKAAPVVIVKRRRLSGPAA